MLIRWNANRISTRIYSILMRIVYGICCCLNYMSYSYCSDCVRRKFSSVFNVLAEHITTIIWPDVTIAFATSSTTTSKLQFLYIIYVVFDYINNKRTVTKWKYVDSFNKTYKTPIYHIERIFYAPTRHFHVQIKYTHVHKKVPYQFNLCKNL